MRAAPAADMPTLLAIDTATEICSVAIVRGDRTVERAEAVAQRHSERILPMVHSLLLGEGLSLSALDAIAFGAGPGAFTGLRIACGVAQGLAFGIGKPVVPVCNLAALAQSAGEAATGARRVLAAIDARMREIYWALYTIDREVLLETRAPALAPIDELESLYRRFAPDLVAGNAVHMLPERDLAELRCATAAQARASAGSIAALALRAFAAGDVVPAHAAAPIYVRDRVASTIAERRAALMSQ